MADDHPTGSEPERIPTIPTGADEPDASTAPSEASPTDPTDPTDPDAAPPEPDPYEGAVPPGYDWPTHGGYLGCLLGLMAACLLSGFVGSLAIGLISVTPLGGIVGTPFARISLLVLAFVVCFGLLGRAGWVLGKRFYREYPAPAARTSAASRRTERARER